MMAESRSMLGALAPSAVEWEVEEVGVEVEVALVEGVEVAVTVEVTVEVEVERRSVVDDGDGMI